jgi:2'-5' RNA ligase
LNVKKGNDELIKIHDRLYTGILREYLVRDISYIPHITVGSLKNKEDFSKAVDKLQALILISQQLLVIL